MNKRTVKINERELSLSNLDKDLYPSYGFTKAQTLEYYGSIAPFMLPFLKDRALTLKRYPQGVEGDFFFQKRCPAPRPAWLETAEVPYGNEKRITYCVANNLETLIWQRPIFPITPTPWFSTWTQVSAPMSLTAQK
jgi:bifunctional non-homologous end joining protein LigD